MATSPDIYSFEVTLVSNGSPGDAHRETTKTIEINGDKSRPADEVEIANLRLKKGKRFTYLYDYGDNIVHSIELIDIRGTEKNE